MKKPRSDAKLLNLPDAKQLEIYKLVKSGVGYTSAVELLAKEHGINTSVGSLHNFYKQAAERFQRERLIKAVAGADAIKEAAQQIGNLNSALIAEMTQKAFELMASDTPDTDAVRDVIGCVLQLKRQEISERSLDLELDKFREQMKTQVEKGLDALFIEIKGNRDAEELFRMLKEKVMQKVGETA